MELISVDSSMLDAVGYDPDAKILVAVFSSGKVYSYYDVPQEEFEGLLAASSKGQYMRDCIIDVYRYSQGMPGKKRR